MKIRPVILCGGAGTRLWPQSKNNLAKQFDNLSQAQRSQISELVGGVTETEILYSCSLPTTKEKAIARPIIPPPMITHSVDTVSLILLSVFV